MISIPDLPIEDPILIFAIAMVIFLSAPLLLLQYRIPGIVGIILVGAAIGPNAIGLLERDATFVLLGEVGIVYLMFVAGLEINFNRFIEHKDRSITFGFLSFLIPQVLGTAVGYWVLGFGLPTALLFASIFASHTLLAYPVINRLGIATNESVTATIGGTIITDTLALLVLAIVIASADDVAGPEFWLTLGIGLSLFFIGVWFLIPRLSRWFFRTVDEESYFEFLFVMAVVFVSAYLAEFVGIEPIVGAFLAGLALNRQIPTTGPLMNRIEFVGNALFIPFFLISVGMLVDVRVLVDGLETITIALAFVGLLLVSKYAAAWATGRMYGYSADECWTMFGLSMGQAAAALAIVLIGFDAGLLGETVLNATIAMILVVSLLSPTIVDRYGRRIVRADADATFDPAEAPHRVMVPFSRDSEYREKLLDLALVLRGITEEPLYTLTVAKPGQDVDADIRAIESSLSQTQAYSAGAEVPVETRTKISRQEASGIVEAVTENRITSLVIGWDGAPARRQSIFGHIIDRVLARTRQLVFVAHVRQPIGITARLILLVPPGVVHHEGFPEAVHHIKQLNETIGATMRVITIGRDSPRSEAILDRIAPDVSMTYDATDDWDTLFATLRSEARETDLVVAMSTRRGTMGWDTALETVPSRISEVTDGNFFVVYPATGDHVDDRQFLRYR